MKATFENTVNILVKAYLNDTLEHKNCFACAVGNLVAHANGYSYVPCSENTEYLRQFPKRFALAENDGKYTNADVGKNWYAAVNNFYPSNVDKMHEELDSIGYTEEQVVAIEDAFEGEDSANVSRELAMFNGLMAVVDVLADIHGIHLKAKEEAKLLFVKA